MPTFRCRTCDQAFEVPDATLRRYPGWTPKHCRAHAPSRRRASTVPRPPVIKEELLTPAQVLERYTAGPSTGVFTDGSAIPNPGPGGFGVVWVEDGRVREERSGFEPMTTNNRMELTALIEAFALLPEDAEVTVYSDSKLCVDTLTKWAPGWERRGWKRKGGEIQNLDLVQPALALVRAHPRCKLAWIQAHAGNRWNEYADALATKWFRERSRRS